MQLTRERIVTAAIGLIEREGAEAVSMRRVATELGCGVMSLYNHVPSKSALLDFVAERVMSAIEFSPVPGASLADEVRAQARAFRAITRSYPRCTMVAVSRPTTSVTGMLPMEHALATLREAGFSGPEAVHIVHAFVAYIVGSLLREMGVSPGLAPDGTAHRPALDPAEFPQVTALAGELLRKDPDADFEFGLELLTRAIEALRPAAVS